MKVYVLVCEARYDGGQEDAVIHTYATIERARKELKQAISEELAQGTYFGDMYAERREDLTINEDENSWEVYENDWGYSNYASYHISTQEVIE